MAGVLSSVSHGAYRPSVTNTLITSLGQAGALNVFIFHAALELLVIMMIDH